MAKKKTAVKKVKKLKPTSPGLRFAEYEDRSDLNKVKTPKKLLKPRVEKAGRSRGKISVRHRGGGVKRMLREIDFKRTKFLGQEAEVVDIQYDPNRSANIALIKYPQGILSFVLAPAGLKRGDKIVCDKKAEVKTGNRMQLKNIPLGTQVYNIEIRPEQGGKLVRSAGAVAIIEAKEGKYVQLRFPSKERRLILASCFATIGQVSNPAHKLLKVGKAGRKRRKGIRPTVRGSAMHPAAHPHGGGEGRASVGLKYPKTPWGKPAYGVKTRKKKKYSDGLIIERRKK